MVGGADGSVRLADGRTVAFADFGPRDAPVVVYLHGNPGSRLDCASEAYQAELNEAGVRLLATDRPGVGGSDPASAPRNNQAAADVAAVAAHLGIEKFAVLGFSRGSLCALACGHLLPDSVRAIGILSGVAPADMPGRGDAMRRDIRAFIWITLRAPAVARAAARNSARRAARNPQATKREFVRVMGSPADRRVLDSALEGWHRTYLETNRQNPAVQVEERRSEFLEPLGFRLEDVAKPVTVWHGAEDRLVPDTHGRYLADQIPGARFASLPGHGHFHTPAVIGRMARALAEQT